MRYDSQYAKSKDEWGADEREGEEKKRRPIRLCTKDVKKQQMEDVWDRI